jgi:hypothetical protein
MSNKGEHYTGGRGGIRTHGTLAGTPVFKTGALNHSATLPMARHQAFGGGKIKNGRNRIAPGPQVRAQPSSHLAEFAKRRGPRLRCSGYRSGLLQRIVDCGELGVELAAKSVHDHDDCQGNGGGNQTVFDGCCAGLISQKSLDGFHEGTIASRD